jgi:hypothetical protein
MHMNSRLDRSAEKTRNEETDKTAGQFRLYIASCHVHHFSTAKLMGVGLSGPVKILAFDSFGLPKSRVGRYCVSQACTLNPANRDAYTS